MKLGRERDALRSTRNLSFQNATIYIYIYINGTFAVFIFCTPALLSGLLARAVTSRYKFRPASSGEREKNLLVRSDRETDRNAGRIGF